MSAAHITLVGKMKVAGGEEQDVTIYGMANVINFYPGSPPPRPHPTPPVGIWPGPGDPDMPGWGNRPHPEHPIMLPGMPGWEPPIKPPEGGGEPPKIEWVVGWTPDTGWAVVGVPQFPHPSPSK